MTWFTAFCIVNLTDREDFSLDEGFVGLAKAPNVRSADHECFSILKFRGTIEMLLKCLLERLPRDR